jgi:hypothetical protein
MSEGQEIRPEGQAGANSSEKRHAAKIKPLDFILN